VDLRNRIAYLE